MNNLLSIGSIAVGSVALAVNLLQVQQAQAVSFIQNGGFAPSNTAQTQSVYLGNFLKAGQTTQFTIPNWTTNGYNFLVPDGTAFSTNLDGLGYSADGNLSLYASSGQSVIAPGGSGWYIAADSAYKQGPISQTLTGLTIGSNYDVTFFQATGQQTGYEGDTTDQWAVNLGGTFNSASYIPPNTNAFTGGVTKFSTVMSASSKAPVSGWTPQKLTFTATATSQVLNFLAEGTPVGQPPFALLAGVDVTPAPVPEPLTIMGTLFGLGVTARLRSKLAKKK
ncbi:PEP-CTERM sorting domain-containing protein [Chamaesiphon sp.]|uniref:PEP-CTERM sorting domain-containing protein n=1 Tax=Chamaesiphon sp. TaxID=2814140 RepID=UPI003594423B